MRVPKGRRPIFLLSLLLAGCGAGAAEVTAPSPSVTPNGSVQVVAVNYELVAKESNRVLIGLVLPDNRFVAYGSIQALHET